MKRHIKLFEDFNGPGHEGGLWVVFRPDLAIYGLYDTLQQAEAAKESMSNFLERLFKSEYGLDAEYDREEEDQINIEHVFPGTSNEEDAMLFAYSSDPIKYQDGWPGQPAQEMVRKLIAAGGNPFASSDADELLGMFNGDIDWMPEEVKARIERMRKTKALFRR